MFFLAKEGTGQDKRKVVLNGVEGTVTFTEAFQRDDILGKCKDSSDHRHFFFFVIGNVSAYHGDRKEI